MRMITLSLLFLLSASAQAQSVAEVAEWFDRHGNNCADRGGQVTHTILNAGDTYSEFSHRWSLDIEKTTLIDIKNIASIQMEGNNVGIYMDIKCKSGSCITQATVNTRSGRTTNQEYREKKHFIRTQECDADSTRFINALTHLFKLQNPDALTKEIF